MPTDQTGAEVTVGDPVKIQGVITAIGGTPQAPTLTIQTKYRNLAAAFTTVTAEAVQVLKDE